MYRNGSVYNCTKWIGSTPIPYFVGDVAPKISRLECKVCHLTAMYIAFCHARIIYVHSTSPWMSRICIHLGVHKHLVSNGACRESFYMAYQCVATEVMKTCQKLNNSYDSK